MTTPSDIESVLQALWELHADTAPVSTLSVASRADFDEPGPMGTDGRSRALPALRALADESRGVELVAERQGDYYWSLDVEAAERRRSSAEQEERLEAGDRDDLERWRAGDALSTLQLRAAQHAADREGAADDARALSALVADREALGR